MVNSRATQAAPWYGEVLGGNGVALLAMAAEAEAEQPVQMVMAAMAVQPF